LEKSGNSSMEYISSYGENIIGLIMDIYERILELKEKNISGVLVTVTDKEGHCPQVSGAKMLITQDKKSFGTIGGGEVEYIAKQEAVKILDKRKNMQCKYILNENEKIIDGIKTNMVCGGAITLFYEFINSTPNVYIFGAGHIGQALIQYLKPLNYNIKLFDSRNEYKDIVKDATVSIVNDYEEFLTAENIPDDSYVVIITHSHAVDYVILKKIYECQSNLKYIGLIASKRKAKMTIAKLQEDLAVEPNLDILHSPIGLKIGGTSPNEIALSIAAEIQAVGYGVKIEK
jgi:xanthine dehydrogenase accessory factor